MVGDVNLFLTNTQDPTLGEIEIMIAGQVHSLGLSHWGCMLQTDVLMFLHLLFILMLCHGCSALISPWRVQVTASAEKCLVWLVFLP